MRDEPCPERISKAVATHSKHSFVERPYRETTFSTHHPVTEIEETEKGRQGQLDRKEGESNGEGVKDDWIVSSPLSLPRSVMYS